MFEKYCRSTIFLWLLLALESCPLMAQMEALPAYHFLAVNQQLPEKLLSGRSVILVQVEDNANPKQWKTISEEAHKGFVKAGVDAVAYFNLNDLLAGKDVTQAFSKELEARKIENLVILYHSRNGFELAVTPFVNKQKLLNFGQAAWKENANDLSYVMDRLYKDAAQSGLKLKNFLIIDQPEYFDQTNIIKANRFASFQPDLKLDKLGVIAFNAPKAPENIVSKVDVSKLESTLAGLNSLAENKNANLEQLLNDMYPYQFGLVDPEREENDIRMKDGYQYLLLRLKGPAGKLRLWMSYGNKPPGNIFSADSVASNFDPDEIVYKYYIRHIYTGDIYLGEVWDAAPVWQDALRNHIRQMRISLKVPEEQELGRK